jgi:type IV pilus assembly protein PilV
MNSSSPNKIRGFTMIETLVAIVIIGLGLLGMLGVVINSLKLSSTSNYRSIAAQQAYSIAEVIRANPPTLATATTEDVFSSPPTSAVNANCLNATGCNRSQYIGSVFKMWKDQLAYALPSGLGTICRDNDPDAHAPTTATGTISNWNCTGSGQYVVKICWNEARISASRVSSTNDFLCTWTNI